MHFELFRLVRPDEIDTEMNFFEYLFYKYLAVSSISNFFVFFPFYIRMKNDRAEGLRYEELERKLKKSNVYLLCLVGGLVIMILTTIFFKD